MAIEWSTSSSSKYGFIREDGKESRRSITVKASYLLLHQLDLTLTILAVSAGLHEMNPFMRNLLTQPLQLAIIKLLIPLLIAWLVPYKLLIPATLFLLVVVGWNIKELVLL